MIGAHRVLVLVLFLAGGAIRAEDSSSNRSALPDGFQTYTGVAFQFTISLPPGWSVFHQMEALTGSPGETGTSVFCSEQVDSSAQTSGDAEAMKSLLGQLSGAETGRIAGFLMDRLPAKNGMACGGFEPKARKKLLKLMETDPMFGPDRTVSLRPEGESVSIGGCDGLRIKGKGGARGGGGKMFDVYAVSDGEFLYLFKLLNLEEHYSKNVGVFEEIISTLELKKASG